MLHLSHFYVFPKKFTFDVKFLITLRPKYRKKRKQMNKHIIFSILLCLFTLNGWAQQRNELNSLAERLERFGREIPQEKVFVHMDNTCYFLVDTI